MGVKDILELGIFAIDLAKKLIDENRDPTAEEMAVLEARLDTSAARLRKAAGRE